MFVVTPVNISVLYKLESKHCKKFLKKTVKQGKYIHVGDVLCVQRPTFNNDLYSKSRL